MRRAQEENPYPYGTAEDWIKDVDPAYVETMAQQAVGNWKQFESFGWDRSTEDDIENWAVVYTSNRDSGLMDQANEKVIESVMSQFPEDQVVSERHGHWAVGHVDGYSIKVYDENGQITPAWEAWCSLMQAMEQYPVLSDETYSEMEFNATLENIADAAGSKVDAEAPDDWAVRVFDWFWENDQSAVESTDDQGGYPSPDQIDTALRALGFLDSEMLQEEVLEHIAEEGYDFIDWQSVPRNDWEEIVYDWLQENNPRSLEDGTPSDVAIYEAVKALGFLSPSSAVPEENYFSDDPNQLDLDLKGAKKLAQAEQMSQEGYERWVESMAQGALEAAKEYGEDYIERLPETIHEHTDTAVIYYSDSFDILRFTDNLEAANDAGSFPQDDVLSFITVAAFYAFQQDVYDKLHEMGAFDEEGGVEKEGRVKTAQSAYSQYWPEVARIAREVAAMNVSDDEKIETVEMEVGTSRWVSDTLSAIDAIQLSDNEQAILEVGMGIPEDVVDALKQIAFWAMREDVLSHSDFTSPQEEFMYEEDM